jgi:hypothetical protein
MGKPYPNYMFYSETKKPTVLDQHFPLPEFTPDEQYYPPDPFLDGTFTTPEERRRFGAARFCGFLGDTIEVEHNLVIPAVSALRKLPYAIPSEPEQHLFASVTDEGFHAQQSQAFLAAIRERFGFTFDEAYKTPLFLQRLEQQRAAEPDPVRRALVTVLNGVVTETRISIELGRFAKDRTLAPAVREVCREHTLDEVVHSSQFKALAEWLWDEFDEETRAAAARFYAQSMVARNLPDVRGLGYFLHQATGRSIAASLAEVLTHYTPDVLIAELLVVARPTIDFVTELGVTKYVSLDATFEQERERLSLDTAAMLRGLDGKAA